MRELEPRERRLEDSAIKDGFNLAISGIRGNLDIPPPIDNNLAALSAFLDGYMDSHKVRALYDPLLTTRIKFVPDENFRNAWLIVPEGFFEKVDSLKQQEIIVGLASEAMDFISGHYERDEIEGRRNRIIERATKFRKQFKSIISTTAALGL